MRAALIPSLTLILGLCVAAPARADALGVAWKVPASGVWPPAVLSDRVIFKSGDTLTARKLDSGKELWSADFAGLRYGAGVMAAGDKYVYVLSGKELLVIDPATGKKVRSRTLAGPISVSYASGSVYVTGTRGVYRYDAKAIKRLGRAKGYTGELRGARGHHVVLHVPRGGGIKAGPGRLEVVSLRSGRRTYTFKLLPGGGHRVVMVDERKVVFIDHSRQAGGKNARKLYYTEADYVKANKLRDRSLARLYTAGDRDVFSAVGTPGSGLVFLGNRGSKKRGRSTLLAYKPATGKVAWTRKGRVTATDLLQHRGRIWTGVVSKGGAARLVAYSPDDGSTVLTVAVGSPLQRPPVAAGKGVLVRTKKYVYLLSSSAPVKAVAPATLPEKKPPVTAGPPTVKVRPGWRQISSPRGRYLAQLPAGWHDEGLRKLGKKGRFMTPLVRKQKIWGRIIHQATVFLYVAGDEGRNARGVFDYALALRKRRNPTLRVTKLRKVKDVGGSGAAGLKAIYWVTGRQGHMVEERSLCVVKGGRAYVLTASVAPHQKPFIWTEIEGIFRTFRPY